LKRLFFTIQPRDNLQMIDFRSTFNIEPDPRGGWQLILWMGDPFDHTTSFRALLGDIAQALGQDRETDLRLPPSEVYEDFIEGTLRFESALLRIYYEHSLSYLALSNDSYAVLRGAADRIQRGVQSA
jgi:hypothetical protein